MITFEDINNLASVTNIKVESATDVPKLMEACREFGFFKAVDDLYQWLLDMSYYYDAEWKTCIGYPECVDNGCVLHPYVL